MILTLVKQAVQLCKQGLVNFKYLIQYCCRNYRGLWQVLFCSHCTKLWCVFSLARKDLCTEAVPNSTLSLKKGQTLKQH